MSKQPSAFNQVMACCSRRGNCSIGRRRLLLQQNGTSLKELLLLVAILHPATRKDCIMIATPPTIVPSQFQGVTFAWLEITPSCTLTCKHCYVASAPGLGHGRMKYADWIRVLDQLKKAGCTLVQFIGGEPTIHPNFCELVEHAACLGFTVEIYTNLVGITDRMWSLFAHYKVQLATSFYTDDAAIHDAITAVEGSFEKTLSNIRKALALHLRLRIGMVDMQDNQRISEGKLLLQSLGIARIGVDRIRGVERGNAIAPEDPVAALCGSCAKGKIAVTAERTVYPCVFSRSFSVGNVLVQPLQAMLSGQHLLQTRLKLQTAFTHRATLCAPDQCDPDICSPQCDPDVCTPQLCGPTYCDPDSCQPSQCEPAECDPDICEPDTVPFRRGKQGTAWSPPQFSDAWKQ